MTSRAAHVLVCFFWLADAARIKRRFQTRNDVNISDLDDAGSSPTMMQALYADAGISAGSKILLIGDSCAAYAGPGTFNNEAVPNTLQDACSGSTVTNAGDSGTLAKEWVANSGQWIKDAFRKGSNDNNKPDLVPRPTYTHVWVSMGGNDVPKCGCSCTAQVKQDLTAAINFIRAEAPGIKIVFTGYPISAQPMGCTIDQTYAGALVPMKELAQINSDVYFADIGDVTGGFGDPSKRGACNATTDKDGVPPCKGSWSYFYQAAKDGIHMNKDGYAAAWVRPKVQQYFDCVLTDNDAGIVIEAAKMNVTIGGCGDVVDHCFGDHSATVQSFCKKTCAQR